MNEPRNIIQLHILINIYIRDSICNRGSDEYEKFIDFVCDVDELLELRKFEVLGESEKVLSDSDAQGISLTLNVSKNIPGFHISGKIDFLIGTKDQTDTKEHYVIEVECNETKQIIETKIVHSYCDALRQVDLILGEWSCRTGICPF